MHLTFITYYLLPITYEHRSLEAAAIAEQCRNLSIFNFVRLYLVGVQNFTETLLKIVKELQNKLADRFYMIQLG